VCSSFRPSPAGAAAPAHTRFVASFTEDLMVPLDRHGFLEECYLTFGYSAITTADGQPGGEAGILVGRPQVVDRQRSGETRRSSPATRER
jgi:hypothetical protein